MRAWSRPYDRLRIACRRVKAIGAVMKAFVVNEEECV
jgi:hypothetical protein